MQVVYEDNHIIIVSKRSGEIVQGDKTGDEPLSETVISQAMYSWGWCIDLTVLFLVLWFLPRHPRH